VAIRGEQSVLPLLKQLLSTSCMCANSKLSQQRGSPQSIVPKVCQITLDCSAGVSFELNYTPIVVTIIPWRFSSLVLCPNQTGSQDDYADCEN
jgi:hypothetical protein